MGLVVSFIFLTSTNFLPVDKIKPGMKGLGLTVFQGTKIDTFSVEIIDVMRNVQPKGDIILARLGGKQIESAGLIGGMSGSPVYIENKLIGAVAYNIGGPFSKEPICGIVPINEMLNSPSNKNIKQGLLTPIKIPMIASDIDEKVISILKQEFPNYELMTAVGKGKIDKELPLTPGVPVGALLVDGDVSISAIGTCTYIDGGKIWAFGHPLLALGETAIPMTTGYVYSVLPSVYFSNKLSMPSQTIGTIERDASRGVYGVLDKIPPMTEVQLSINGEKFSYRIAKERHLLPSLVDILVLNSMLVGSQVQQEITAQAEVEVKLKDYELIKYKRSSVGKLEDIVRYIDQPIHVLQTNSFKEVDVEKITMNISIYKELKMANITDLLAEKKETEPCEELSFHIVLQPFQKEPMKKKITVAIPKWAQKGELELEVGKKVENKADIESINSIEKLVKYLKDSPKENELTITLSQKGKSTCIGNEKFPSPPPSLTIEQSENKQQGKNTIFEKKIETEYIISNSKNIILKVK